MPDVILSLKFNSIQFDSNSNLHLFLLLIPFELNSFNEKSLLPLWIEENSFQI